MRLPRDPVVRIAGLSALVDWLGVTVVVPRVFEALPAVGGLAVVLSLPTIYALLVWASTRWRVVTFAVLALSQATGAAELVAPDGWQSLWTGTCSCVALVLLALATRCAWSDWRSRPRRSLYEKRVARERARRAA